MSRRVVAGVFVVLVAVTAHAVAPAVVLGATYGIDVSSSVDTPTRTVSIEDTEYQVSAVGRVDPGETIQAHVTAPSDVYYDLVLYNADGQSVTYAEGQGDADLSLDTGSLEPGSYVLALDADGVIEKVHPVVIEAYDTSLSAPGSVERGTTANATVSLSPTGSTEPIDSVEVVLTNGSWTQRVEATKTDEHRYRAALDTDIEPGSYRAYAAVRGTESANGRNELLGISDADTFEVTSATTTTTNETTTTETNESSTTTNETTTTETSGNSTTTSNTTTDNTTTTTASGGGLSPTTDTTTTTTATLTTTTTTRTTVTTSETTVTTTEATTTTTASNVITPNEGETVETTANTGAPFPTALSILSLLAGTLLWARTR